MQGWFKLHRKLTESAIYSDPDLLRLWILCLAKATHKETTIVIDRQQVNLQPGEFVTGRKALTDDYNIGLKPRHRKKELSIWRDLKFLEECGNVNIKATNKFSVISVVKWCEYQENEQQMNNNRTTDEQQLNTNKNVKKKELISTTTTEQTESESINSVYSKVFGSFSIQPLIGQYIVELKQKGYTDAFVKELLLETGQASTRPNLNLLKTIGERWEKESIYTRVDAKRRKDAERLQLVPDQKTKKGDPQRETLRRDIAFNKWVAEGKDPNEFDFNTATGA